MSTQSPQKKTSPPKKTYVEKKIGVQAVKEADLEAIRKFTSEAVA